MKTPTNTALLAGLRQEIIARGWRQKATGRIPLVPPGAEGRN
ncbi:MAG: hypothetical protein SF339_15460 [Blastocatellia bacterium]|nr:hypothetical protein [Blastocatellia bacterium]